MPSVCRLIVIVTLCCAVFAAPALGQSWSELTPASGPAPTGRTLAAAIYDPSAHAMIIFGGQDAGGRLNEVWAFDLATNTWSDLTPATGDMPAARITPATVYDSHNHDLLTFSGQGKGGTFFNDTWAFDLTTHTWAEYLPPDPLPAIRYGVASVYDPIAQTQVIFAGFTFQGRFDDTQRFDPAAVTWTDVSPVSGSPLERCLHAACFDSADRRMIMYGGQNSGTPLGDIWAFDLAGEAWTELTPATGPDARWFTAMEYDSVNHRPTMFGGNRGVLGRANDVWVFDLTTGSWVELMPAGTAPTPRDGAASVYVPSQDRLVVFGGMTDGGEVNEVWSLDDLSDTPTSAATRRVPAFALHGASPNPFGTRSTILFDVPGEGASVTLAVFDARGRRVRTLVDGFKTGGAQRAVWNGRDDAGRPLASGVYFYRLTGPGFTSARKVVFVK